MRCTDDKDPPIATTPNPMAYSTTAIRKLDPFLSLSESLARQDNFALDITLNRDVVVLSTEGDVFERQ